MKENQKLVLDASMALSWLFTRQDLKERALSENLLASLDEYESVVPSLWHSEIANGLLVGERRKLIDEPKSIDYLSRLPMLFIKTDIDLNDFRKESVLSLARHYSLTAYDATYLELALRLGATLATFDQALARAMVRAGGSVFQ